jgi:hypothetical protein
MELHNLDELYDITLELSNKAYNPESSAIENHTFLNDSEDFPVLLYKDNDTLYVAFRGTNTDISTYDSVGNTINNILIDITTTDPLGLGNYLSYYDTFKFFIKGEYQLLKAHEGYIKVLDKIYFDLRQMIDGYDCSKVILTGHSAGGGLATLFYYLYENDIRNTGRTKPIKYVITYGSPRVIYDFPQNIELYNENCKNLTRIFNLGDIVSYAPFKKSLLFTDNITSGFTHVGKPLCLDSNVSINSLNGLTIMCARKNIQNIQPLLDQQDYFTSLETLQYLYTDKYLALMTDCLFESFQSIITDENATPAMIEAYTLELKDKSSKLENYNGKCELLRPLGISDILKKNPIGETKEQEDTTIAAIGGAILGMNQLSVEAHRLSKYRENLDILINQEVEQRKPIEEEDKEFIFSTSVKPVSTEDILDKLMEKIELDVESGKIVGITPNADKGLILYDI